MIKKEEFGRPRDGNEIESYSLENKNGMKVVILTYGGILKELWVPDRNGKLKNVVLSYDNIQDYSCNPAYLGAIIGRTAGRIEGGLINIGKKVFRIPKNNGENTLHGGPHGFHKKIMKANVEETALFIRLTLKFEDLEMNNSYPGTLDVKISYTLMKFENVLKLYMESTTDKETYLNMTSHSYFNLSNDSNAPISKHELEIKADNYAPVKEDMIPIWGWNSVKNTAFDFTKSKLIGSALYSEDNQIRKNKGIDHPFKLNTCTGKKEKFAVEMLDQDSGRIMKVYTTQPHMVIYTGNFLHEAEVPSGKKFIKHNGICFEAQEVPNAPNFSPDSCSFLSPKQRYFHSITYSFETY